MGQIKYFSPIPNAKAHVFPDEPFRCYVMFSSDDLNVELSYFSQVSQKKETIKVDLNVNKCPVVNSNLFHKIAVKSMFDEYEKASTNSKLPDKIELIDLAVKCQVLCDKTAFICVIHEYKGGKEKQSLNIIVPNQVPIDYQDKHEEPEKFKSRGPGNVFGKAKSIGFKNLFSMNKCMAAPPEYDCDMMLAAPKEDLCFMAAPIQERGIS